MGGSSQMPAGTRLIVFAKLPRLGQVKTRLQNLLGAEGCLRLHYCLIDHALSLAEQWQSGPVELWFSEPPGQEDLRSALLADIYQRTGIDICYQHGANLGQRMQHALQKAVEQGDRAVLIGSDCPLQEIAHLQQAEQLLISGSEVVIQPALDGGFVLIGCNKNVPDLTGDIAWGSSEVCGQVEKVLKEKSLSYGKIETISDLDTERDFLLLQKRESPVLQAFQRI